MRCRESVADAVLHTLALRGGFGSCEDQALHWRERETTEFFWNVQKMLQCSALVLRVEQRANLEPTLQRALIF